MRFICSDSGRLVSIELSPEETYELLAFETNCAQLVPEKNLGLLETTMRKYGISREEMAPFLDKPSLTRDDVWELQLLKRRIQRDHQAVEAIRKVRCIELELGVRILEAFVNRSRIQFAERG